MKEKEYLPEEDVRITDARGLLGNAQYVNANYAIGRIEADKDGLDSGTIWHETEWLRTEMLKTERKMRHHMVETLYQELKKKYKAERSVMCIMVLFALRLITANKDQKENPNRPIIRNIVRVLSDKAKADEQLMADMKLLLKTINEDGDRHEEEDGIVVEFGVDILADDSVFAESLRGIIDHYVGLADAAGLIDFSRGDDFEAIWKELIVNPVFQQEMRVSTLGKDFNLKLIFNVFGLIPLSFYKTKVRGAKSIARVVGENPKARGKDKFYGHCYFNPTDIEKRCGSSYSAIKSAPLLKLIKDVIGKYDN